MARTLISDPKCYRPYLTAQNIPELTDAERDDLRNTLKALAGMYLNMAESWKVQTSVALKKFMEEAKVSLPFLERYEDAWPARAIGQYILQKRRKGGNQHAETEVPPIAPRRRRSSIPGLTAVERSQFFRVMAEEAKTYLQHGRSWTQQTREARNNFLTQMDQRLPFLARCGGVDAVTTKRVQLWLHNHRNDAPWVVTRRSPSVEMIDPPTCSAHHHETDKDTATGTGGTLENTDTETPSSTHMNDQPETELVNFLTFTIGPFVAQELMSVLRGGGVTTLAHLAAVAQMPLAQQVKFLRNDLDLNPHQLANTA